MKTAKERNLFLKNIDLFANMTDDERELIGRFSRIQSFKPGQIIIKEDEHEEALNLYIVINGELAMLKTVETKEGERVEKIFRYLKDGDYFGEIEVFVGETLPASATIIGVTEGRMLVIDGKKFLTVLNKYPHLTIQVCGQFSRRMRELNKAHVTGEVT
ncbi:MAG: cyclic nucleotide-binding domain-containing protein [Gemmatimonadetes bacterium]|nr:MAG: cyclic nucleotide-binding domain-containing protein [Gemmatimonadota bacterium]